MIKYVFAEDSPLTIRGSADADPQVIGTSLEEIRTANGGEIQPKAVVDAARSKKNPLHRHFEWDNVLAAESFRLDQARSLIRCVRVLDTSVKSGSVRAFLSLNTASGVNYHAVKDVQNSSALRAALLLQAEKDLDAWEKRYKELQEICEVVAKAREMISEKRSGVRENHPNA
jgi:hypothetical protein